MMPLRLADVLAGTGGTVRGAAPADAVFARIERDARRAGPGDLFIAVRGERFDGHQFVGDAAGKGAIAALVSTAWADAQPQPPLPLIAVDEPVAALQRLAGWRRAQLRATVVGITGSLGKTSTKEVVAAVLSRRFRTYKSPGNLNNEIGLPLCLLDVTPETEIAVLEMGGAYAFGELTLLSGIARQRIAVVTNVHPIHLERMGTIEAIAETKAELVEALPPDGVAILNGDDPRVRSMAARAPGRVLFFGHGADNDVRASDVVVEGAAGSRFTLDLAGEQHDLRIAVAGGHAVDLALPAIAVAHALGMTVEEMRAGLADPAAQIRLMVRPGPRGSRLIDDAYNASTPSVLSALDFLAAMPGQRKIAVLGDMRELGPLSEREHRIVGRRAAEVVDLLVTFGGEARVIAAEAAARIDGPPPSVTSFGLTERRSLIDFLREGITEGDVVLLKGSRGLQMEEIVAALGEALVRDDGMTPDGAGA
ncbi:MAG TPA: UDP-N-acetylmuramoyl-tripeptide--D-alanyl-D-alanine ligase [Thermomicrobiales bacterium]|nr:UDP-N-acetylmuramoyl-tripeptide--D-alanyl-D-alanine ligase [Thermomicrobiales bacterium]